MKRHPAVRLLESREVIAGRAFRVLSEVVELPSGLRQDLLVIEHPGAVAIVPVLDDGRILLVRQYRHAIGEWLVEIPAGRLELRETPAAAARRELEEETGLRAARLDELGVFFPAPGFCSERIWLFAAHGLAEAPADRAPMDSDEEFEVLRLAPQEALEAVRADAKSWIALTRFVQAGRR
jgi:ADP-ribose pyrophosphatase